MAHSEFRVCLMWVVESLKVFYQSDLWVSIQCYWQDICGALTIFGNLLWQSLDWVKTWLLTGFIFYLNLITRVLNEKFAQVNLWPEIMASTFICAIFQHQNDFQHFEFGFIWRLLCASTFCDWEKCEKLLSLCRLLGFTYTTHNLFGDLSLSFRLSARSSSCWISKFDVLRTLDDWWRRMNFSLLLSGFHRVLSTIPWKL